MNIIKATASYEDWLRQRITVIDADLDYKYAQMSSGLHEFFRATFYRWVQQWPKVCKELSQAPEVLAIGDIHSENFGTWLDIEGRLVWGVNDFDEACRLAYTADLVRLATSAVIALQATYQWKPKLIAEIVMAGYQDNLRKHGEPFVLAERHQWLTMLAYSNMDKPEKYWNAFNSLPPLKQPLPEEAKYAIEAVLPVPDLDYKVTHRVAGLGSLGRRRYLACAQLGCSMFAREAKELTISAIQWAVDAEEDGDIHYQTILKNSIRSYDPYLQVLGNWIVRRMSPDYTRIPLRKIPENKVAYLLYCMGSEVANIHLGNGNKAIRAVRDDLRAREDDWLVDATKAMLASLEYDYESWMDHYYSV